MINDRHLERAILPHYTYQKRWVNLGVFTRCNLAFSKLYLSVCPLVYLVCLCLSVCLSVGRPMSKTDVRILIERQKNMETSKHLMRHQIETSNNTRPNIGRQNILNVTHADTHTYTKTKHRKKSSFFVYRKRTGKTHEHIKDKFFNTDTLRHSTVFVLNLFPFSFPITFVIFYFFFS